MEVERWRLRIYVTGFLVAFAFYLVVDGSGRGLAFWLPAALSIAAICYGTWSAGRVWLRAGATFAVIVALTVPVVEEAVVHAEPLAGVVGRTAVWPQLLVTLLGSRVLATECDLSFAEFWRQPGLQRISVEIQSIPAAVALGGFLTIVFYLTVPHLVSASSGGPPQSSAILVSAMQGGTVVHSAIVFLFFVIMSVIIDASRLYLIDCRVLATFRRLTETKLPVGSKQQLRSIVEGKLGAQSHTRAVRILGEAIDIAVGQRDGTTSLAALSFDGFREASRRFVRALLPFLPLLGFLGTVIGLATAIAELPQGLAEGTGRSFDISGSLAGLAIKFETTLLGLLGSMTSSLALNLLEKKEAEFAAECLLAVEAVFATANRGADA
jgi:hypothetical protein